MEYVFNYGGGVIYDGGTITIFSRLLTATEALYKYTIVCSYINGAWVVKLLFSDFSIIPGANIQDTSVTNAKLAGSITLAKLLASTRGFLIRAQASGIWTAFNAATSGNLLIGDGTDVNSTAMSGDATISGSGVLTIGNDKITTAKILNSNVTVAKVISSLKTELITVPVTFATGRLGAYKVLIPYDCTITNIYATASLAIAATDVATITPKDNSGTTMTVTTPISFAAADVFGTAYSSAVTANNSFTAGQILTLFTAKTTAGGEALVSLTVLKS